MSDETPAPLRSFGRIKGRPVKPRQAKLLDELLPRIAPDVSRPVDAGGREAWLEIGFGGGEHLAEQAARNPDVLLFGAEPFLNGVASAVRWVDERGLDNVRIHHGDARDLVAAIPDGALTRVFVLFPDPWHKLRHHKRRLMQPAFLSEVARVLRPGGVFRFATDWKDYADWTLERALKEPRLRWTAERADDWRTPPADHVTTRYEVKKLGDTPPIFLEFERV